MRVRLKKFEKENDDEVLIIPAGNKKLVFKRVGDVSFDLDEKLAKKLVDDYPDILELVEEKG